VARTDEAAGEHVSRWSNLLSRDLGHTHQPGGVVEGHLLHEKAVNAGGRNRLSEDYRRLIWRGSRSLDPRFMVELGRRWFAWTISRNGTELGDL